MLSSLPFLFLAICLIAFLYSSVGHGGASGYIAMMTLLNIAPAEIKPVALVLNILVATIGSWQFWRAGHSSWRLIWPFVIFSCPLAYLGGYLSVPAPLLKITIGTILLFSAAHFLFRPSADSVTHEPSKVVSMILGAVLGLLSGLTGTGGGIFLTPILIFKQWANTKTASGVSAFFILVNSVFGLLGNLTATQKFPFYALPLGVAVILGGTLGAYLASRHFQPATVRRLLAIVLVIAGFKLIFA